MNNKIIFKHKQTSSIVLSYRIASYYFIFSTSPLISKHMEVRLGTSFSSKASKVDTIL